MISRRRETDVLERLLEVVVFAPIGFGLTVRDEAPEWIETFVARGRAEVDKHQETLARHATTARSHGQVAMAFGLPKLQARVQHRLDDVLERVTGANPPPAASTAPQPAVRPEPTREGAGVAPPEAAPPSVVSELRPDRSLPILGYDALSASQVVERLAGLAPDELEAVRAYEANHRNRRTILGKIEQLAS